VTRFKLKVEVLGVVAAYVYLRVTGFKLKVGVLEVVAAYV
jgi:hypothetical protein